MMQSWSCESRDEDLTFLSSLRPESSGLSTRTPCLPNKRMFCRYSVPPTEARMLALCRPLLRFHIKDNCTFMCVVKALFY